MTTFVQSTRAGRSARRIIAIGAGKGGVGSSMITANLGIFLAQIGKRVVLVDLNLPDPGLHAWLGDLKPKRTINDLLGGRLKHIEDAVMDTSITGLYLVAGAAILPPDDKVGQMSGQLFEQLETLDTDFVLVDLPSGLNPVALDILGRADLSIVVTAATPDSVQASYRLFCAVFMRSLLSAQEIDDVSRDLLIEMSFTPGKLLTPREITGELLELGSNLARRAQELSETFHPQIIVNKTRIKADEDLGAAMVSAAMRWVGIRPRLLGSVGWDDNVWLALRRAQPLLIDFARSRVCKDLERIVRGILSQEYKDLFAPSLISPPTKEKNLKTLSPRKDYVSLTTVLIHIYILGMGLVQLLIHLFF